jgi:pseudaminic acid cytidylyltransferase
VISKNKRVAIIPARGGSKRIPNKNYKDFLGTPSILRTISVLDQSSIFDQIVVSSDSDLILQMISTSVASGVKRPRELAEDTTPTVPVLRHAIEALSLEADALVCCVYPINPFLTTEAIVGGLEMLISENSVDYVCPVVSYPYPPQRALLRENNGLLNFEKPEFAWTRSQELTELYHDAGQWYWGRAQTWLLEKPMLHNTLGKVVPRWVAQDIDTQEDWEYAELLFEVLERRNAQEGPSS